MKKVLLSISFLLITTLNYSQNSKIKFGVQGGLNYSNFWGYEIPIDYNAVYSESPAFAYLGGLNLEYQIQDRLSLKLELNYERKSQKGNNFIEIIQNFEEPSQVYNYTTKKNYDYLVLPILLKYSFSDQNSFYVNGGPFIGFLLKSIYYFFKKFYLLLSMYTCLCKKYIYIVTQIKCVNEVSKTVETINRKIVLYCYKNQEENFSLLTYNINALLNNI